MPQSLSNIILHIVFGTRHRVPCLIKPVRTSLFPYMSTIVRNAGSECYRAGGVEDHVHLAVRLNRTETVADLVRDVKAGSSKWLKHRHPCSTTSRGREGMLHFQSHIRVWISSSPTSMDRKHITPEHTRAHGYDPLRRSTVRSWASTAWSTTSGTF
jgi:REP element-mobilizing transposase RayT